MVKVKQIKHVANSRAVQRHVWIAAWSNRIVESRLEIFSPWPGTNVQIYGQTFGSHQW